MRPRRDDREGMALLTVLILVAVLAAIAVVVLDDVRFSIRRAHNTEVNGQAQWYALGAERVARRQIRRLVNTDPARTPIQPAWDGRPFVFPIDHGEIALTVRDGQACFNLNSVVDGAGGVQATREEGVRQFLTLQRLVGVPAAQARVIAAATADWIDSDQQPQPFGGEDAAYRLHPDGKRPSGMLMIEPSELRQVLGMDETAYRRLRPYVCALPTTNLSPLNANTLRPEDAPVLAMLADGDLTLEAARRAIAARPAAGWESASAFWGHPAFAQVSLIQPVRDQVTLHTRYFDFEARVTVGDGTAVRSGLIVATQGGQVGTAIARWTAPE